MPAVGCCCCCHRCCQAAWPYGLDGSGRRSQEGAVLQGGGDLVAAAACTCGWAIEAVTYYGWCFAVVTNSLFVPNYSQCWAGWLSSQAARDGALADAGGREGGCCTSPLYARCTGAWSVLVY